MIELYSWPTPNGKKVHIALEEMGLAYNVHPINIGKGEQFEAHYREICPSSKIPAIIDTNDPGGEPLALFESGAILLYLAEKTGRFLPTDPAGRYRAIQWLMYQVGGVGPTLGQCGHFRNQAPEKIQYAIDRYTQEAERVLGVLERRLSEAEYLAGEYSIADMATYPWVNVAERLDLDLEHFPAVSRWLDAIDDRPAVQRGLALLT